MFLRELLRHPDREWSLVNADTGAVLAHVTKLAGDSQSRKQGLLGRTGMDNEALVIAPCNAVHTFFMQFALDVVFVDRDGLVRKCCTNVRPWRIAATWRAFAAIEVPAGIVERTGTARGQRVAIVAR